MLVLGWGNPGRGDDALGPRAVHRLRALVSQPATVEFIDDYQLLIEHAMDLVGRTRVLLIDASANAAAPFELSSPQATVGCEWTTHALSPQALLRVYLALRCGPPPPCTLLAIRAEQFGLGEPMSAAAERHLEAALHWALGWLASEGAQ